MSFDEPTGPSTNYARTEQRFVSLASTYGQQMAQLFFGLNNDILEGILGRYVRGKRVGKLRGFLLMAVVTHGGWIRGIGVVPRGTMEVHLCTGFGRDTKTLFSYYRKSDWRRVA